MMPLQPVMPERFYRVSRLMGSLDSRQKLLFLAISYPNSLIKSHRF